MKRGTLGFWMCTALVVGNMIGSGVFLLPASLAPYGGISIIGWVITAAGAMLLALVFARLSRLVPKAGGPYAYTRYGFGDFAAFLVAWGYWISIWSGNAAISIAFTGYLGVFLPSITRSALLSAGTALAAIWFLTWINSRGVRNAGIVQLITTVLKLMPLAAVGILGLFYVSIDNFLPFNLSGSSGFSAITATATLTLWAFLGLESATIPSGEVKNPSRTIPRATIVGTLLTAIVYILGTVAVMGVIPPAVLARSTAPFADAASLMWGGWAGYAVAAGAAISCFGALNGWILLQGQLPLAAESDGLFPRLFGRLGRNGTPVAGLIVSSLLITILVGMNFTRSLVDLYTFVILLATLTTLIPYVFSAATELLIYVRERERFDGRRLWGAAGISLLALSYSIWAIIGIGREALLWGTVLLLCGVPVYLMIGRSRSSKESGEID
ncbi:amino acid permease [Candidatus Zixiibacteriota bacterium]